MTADTEVTAGLRKALAHVSAPSFELAVHRFEASEETLPEALVLTLVGHATTRRTPDTARVRDSVEELTRAVLARYPFAPMLYVESY